MLAQWLWSYGCNSHFFEKMVILSIFHDVLCFSPIYSFFPQILHLHIQPDHHSICNSMLYKKNGLLNTLLKLFGRYRGAKRHERQNPIFYVFSLIFYAFANFSYLVSANLIEYDLIIYLLGIPSDKILF